MHVIFRQYHHINKGRGDSNRAHADNSRRLAPVSRRLRSALDARAKGAQPPPHCPTPPPLLRAAPAGGKRLRYCPQSAGILPLFARLSASRRQKECLPQAARTGAGGGCCPACARFRNATKVVKNKCSFSTEMRTGFQQRYEQIFNKKHPNIRIL